MTASASSPCPMSSLESTARRASFRLPVMQSVLVHVDARALAMAGAIYNVSRARLPVIMIAGTSPVTEEEELPEFRNVRSILLASV